MSETLIIRSLADLSGAVKRIQSLLSNGPVRIKLTKASRTLDQNALFHLWCDEIAEFFVQRGKSHFASGASITKDTIKQNLKETFLGTEEREYIDLQTGEIRARQEVRHTADLDKGEMSHFMACVDKWASEFGIPLSRPEFSEYMTYQREQGEAA